MYKFSENLAWVAGVVLPIGETLRRWGSWWEFPLVYLDDLFIGAFFLFAAWKSRQGDATGSRWLAASFGCGCGMGYSSWASTMAQLDFVDPSGVSGTAAAVVKASMLGLALLGLFAALRGRSG
jgi:hypothetical protein